MVKDSDTASPSTLGRSEIVPASCDLPFLFWLDGWMVGRITCLIHGNNGSYG